MTTMTTPTTEVARVLIADSFSDAGVADLEAIGCAVHADAGLSGDALVAAVRELDPDAIVVRSTKVPEPVFDAGTRLALVVRAGAGYDTIDVNAASERGISVANCPGMNAIAVAELAWGLILACDRRIPDQAADLRNGIWAKKSYAKARGLYGRTLGVIGLGRIGREVACRGQAFGMKVVGWSRSLTPDRAEALGIGSCDNLATLAGMSDVISINVAATSETRHLVDAAFCANLRPGTILVNTSRGSVIDQSALSEAIDSKGIRAGLDVFANEPGSGESPFAEPIVQQPGVFGTHHVGASTDQAQDAIAGEAVRVIRNWIATGAVENCVNLADETPASTLLTIRHLNRPGVLAHVFEGLGTASINVEEMENVIYAGGQAACARIQVAGELDDDTLARIRANDAVFNVTTTPIKTTDHTGADA